MLMRLSQGQLKVLQTCPRKFQHLYLDQLSSPLPLEQQEAMNWGNRFHLRMQQRELGLTVVPTSPAEVVLEQSVQALIQTAPELFQSGDRSFRQSEHRRSLEFQGYLLTVVYDLLILSEQQAQIVDWKTYPKPQHPRWLQQDWQTRLYSFVLAETSRYLPEQISMTYWFVRAASGETEPPQPQSLQFSYNATQHEQTRQDLSRQLSKLTDWSQAYDTDQSFPQVDELSQHCATCTFGLRCQRGGPTQTTLPLTPLSDWETIEEIPI